MYKYNSLREKIAAEKAERQQKYATFEQTWQRAVTAGHEAALECTPKAMGVYDPVTGDGWLVHEGPCGFAEIRLSKGNTSFARWAKKNAGFKKHYYGGLYYWVSNYNQSMERKYAFAKAACDVLRASGVDCFPTSRMD
jgi:hypothetical protein